MSSPLLTASRIFNHETTLNESPDFELCQISEKKPGVLDELVAERKGLIETESAELERQASQLAEEITELTGEEATRIR